MRILAVGDSFMPSSYFERSFARLECEHSVTYMEVDPESPFLATSTSELRLKEFQGAPREVAERMAGVEILVVHGAPVTDEVLAASSGLMLVACARGGPVNVDTDALTERGLPLVTTPGKNAEAVADQTLAFLVMLARGFSNAQSFFREGGRLGSNWDGARFMGHDLRGHVLGLVGFGNVGHRVATRALAFGMKLLVYDPYVELGFPKEVEAATSLQELLARADFVSLHARATRETENLINGATLAAMRPGSFLVNTARETLVDEEALDEFLASGHLAGVALDVVRDDESGRAHRLLRHENVVITPHIGGATYETLLCGAEMIAEEIARFATGAPLRNVILPAALNA